MFLFFLLELTLKPPPKEMSKTSPMWRLRTFLLLKFASVPTSLLKYIEASNFIKKIAKISKTMISTIEEEREKKSSEINVVKAAAEGKTCLFF